jgi:hypothetical protein
MTRCEGSKPRYLEAEIRRIVGSRPAGAKNLRDFISINKS